ncbi:hypothetical protein GCM10022206_81800 [Streptomyces chiangmaiensis]
MRPSGDRGPGRVRDVTPEPRPRSGPAQGPGGSGRLTLDTEAVDTAAVPLAGVTRDGDAPAEVAG